MKDGWERMDPPVSLDVREIGDIVRPAFPGRRVVAAERIGTGLSNSNYKVRLEDHAKPYVVRLYRQGKDIAEKEAAIADLVRGTVPIADFLHFDASCRTFRQPWAVLEWKDGILLRDVLRRGTAEGIASAAEAVGRALAAIHRHAFAESGFFNKDFAITQRFPMNGDRFLSFIEGCLIQQPCGTWLGDELVRALWEFCQTHAPRLTESGEQPVLVHSDFNGLNILMRQHRGGYDVSAVLDWEYAFAWNRHADLGNPLRYEEEGSLFERHAIRGYREEGAVLEPNWRLLAKLEDLVALCDMLNASTADTPNRVRDLRRLVAKTVQTQE